MSFFGDPHDEVTSGIPLRNSGGVDEGPITFLPQKERQALLPMEDAAKATAVAFGAWKRARGTPAEATLRAAFESARDAEAEAEAAWRRDCPRRRMY